MRKTCLDSLASLPASSSEHSIDCHRRKRTVKYLLVRRLAGRPAVETAPGGPHGRQVRLRGLQPHQATCAAPADRLVRRPVFALAGALRFSGLLAPSAAPCALGAALGPRCG